jgi:hypothetical protein
MPPAQRERHERRIPITPEDRNLVRDRRAGRSTARYSHVAFLLPAAQPFLPGDGGWATIALPHNKIQKCEET